MLRVLAGKTEVQSPGFPGLTLASCLPLAFAQYERTYPADDCKINAGWLKLTNMNANSEAHVRKGIVGTPAVTHKTILPHTFSVERYTHYFCKLENIALMISRNMGGNQTSAPGCAQLRQAACAC